MTLPLNLMLADVMPRKEWLTNQQVKFIIERKYGPQDGTKVSWLLIRLNLSPNVTMHRRGKVKEYQYKLLDMDTHYLINSIRRADRADLTDWMKELIQPRVKIPPGVLMAQFNQLIGEVRMR
ncbi:hypothetical protein N5923_23425 [Erwiniaceae bacterium BAC15a-03b]|uniref:Uncharacterized protein n=1 Tax=Winslowiella arboricola TaxID=2978220 RepID=A0A9J6Q2G4_9GAMM|nr:hypothetical protein [Winslowiella arboricola]MCU5775099.1 hypothetical protein [Winslowiella arboricola]MCU5780447.1 hypothetical protein [Winslowiella arboricola]